MSERRCREGFSSPDKFCILPAGHKGEHKFKEACLKHEGICATHYPKECPVEHPTKENQLQNRNGPPSARQDPGGVYAPGHSDLNPLCAVCGGTKNEHDISSHYFVYKSVEQPSSKQMSLEEYDLRSVDGLREEVERLTHDLQQSEADCKGYREENERLRALLRRAMDEMCHVPAPRNSFTDTIDAIDEALRPTDETSERRPTRVEQLENIIGHAIALLHTGHTQEARDVLGTVNGVRAMNYITDKEAEAIRKHVAEHYKQCKQPGSGGAISVSPYQIVIAPNSVSYTVCVRCACGDVFNATDYSDW